MDAYLILSVVAVIILLVLSGFFSGSETALTAVSRTRLNRLSQDGDRRARTAVRLRERKERLIGSLLLGNTLANVLASVLAASIAIQMAGAAGVVYATILMTALVLVVSEVLPKTYAINHPERVALGVARPAEMLVRAMSPVALGVQAVVRWALRLFGVESPRSIGLISLSDDLHGTVPLGHRDRAVVKHERDMLASILDLDLVAVSDVMVHRRTMKMIDASDPPQAIVEQVLGSAHTRLPLWRDNPDNIIGVLHAKDLLRAVGAAGGRVEELDIAAIASEPWFVPETTTLYEQLQAFRQRRAHFALVVDEYGALMGMVTLEDILEEIVGDIRDEHDLAVSGVRAQPDGSYLVDGTVTIRDLNRQFDWHLPDEEAATIAGLVIHEARVIPDVGQAFSFHGFEFQVLRRQRNQITQLRLRAPARPDAA